MGDREKMIHALTAYDRVQSKRPGFNRYALPQYFAAVDDVFAEVSKGVPMRRAILGAFSGRVATVALRSQGLDALTLAEARS